VLLLAAFVGVAVSARQPQPDPKVAQTLADWRARQERVQSVRYTLSGAEETVSKPEVPPALKNDVVPTPPGPKEKSLKVTLLIDITNRQFRLEVNKPTPSKNRDQWVAGQKVDAFDGQTYQTAYPRDKNDRGPDEPDISIAKGNLGAIRTVESYLFPAFAAHGIVPTVDAPLRPDRFPAAHEPDDFEARGTVSHAGRQCVVLRTNATGTMPNLSDEFWVDLGRQGAILRHTYWQGKNPWFRQDIEYTQTPHGWLPAKWTHTSTIGGRVTTIRRLNVDSVEVNPPLRKEDFTLPIEPGMIVLTHEYPDRGKGLDPNRPAKGKYRVGSDGEWEPLEPQTGFTTKEGIQLPPESGSRWWLWWTLGAVGLLVVLFVGVRVWRRRSVGQPR